MYVSGTTRQISSQEICNHIKGNPKMTAKLISTGLYFFIQILALLDIIYGNEGFIAVEYGSTEKHHTGCSVCVQCFTNVCVVSYRSDKSWGMCSICDTIQSGVMPSTIPTMLYSTILCD